MSMTGDSHWQGPELTTSHDLHMLISVDNEHSSLIIQEKETQTQSGEQSTQREEH